MKIHYEVGEKVLVVEGPFKGSEGFVACVHYFGKSYNIYSIKDLAFVPPIVDRDVDELYCISPEIVPYSELAKTLYL